MPGVLYNDICFSKTHCMKTLISFLLSCFITTSFAQIQVSGHVTDPKDKPIEFATVLIKEGTSVIGNAYSTDKGEFAITVPRKGTYNLIVYFLGYDTRELAFTATEDTLLKINLNPSPTTMKEVVIEGRTLAIERQVDRLVFNVEKSTGAAGGDALDALKLAPGVRVQNDKITMVGKSGLQVMIDDKLVQMTDEQVVNLLKTMSAANISKIEIITNPGAQYDAAGNSGLINIKLKTALPDSWNSTLNGAFNQTTYGSGRGGASFNYKKNKLSVSSNVGVNDDKRLNTDKSTLYYPNQTWSNLDPRTVENGGISGRLGIDYDISSRWKVGLQYLGSSSQLSMHNQSTTTLTHVPTGVIDSLIYTLGHSKETAYDHSFNLNSSLDLDTIGRKISGSLDYFTFNTVNTGDFNNINLYSDRRTIPSSHYAAFNTNNQQVTNYSAKMDVEYPTKLVNLLFGGKASFTKTTNNVAFYNTTTGIPVIDPGQTNVFEYSENNQAIYASGSRKFGTKWQSQVGLRAENTQTQGISASLNQQNNNAYTKLFPTAFLTYVPNDSSSFALSYGRRINRPNYEQLNPFRIFVSPYLYVEGNPYLQPSFSDNVEFSYTYKKLSSKLYYSYLQNGFQQLLIVSPNVPVQHAAVLNYFNTQSTGITEAYTFSKFSWWESANTFDFFYSKSRSTSSITNQGREGANAVLATNNDFTLSKKKNLVFNITYWYNFAGNIDLYQNSAFSQLDLALKTSFLKKKLVVALIGQDVLGTNRPVITGYTNGIKAVYANYYDNRMFRISLTYTFGNNALDVAQKDIGNREEKDRTGR